MWCSTQGFSVSKVQRSCGSNLDSIRAKTKKYEPYKFKTRCWLHLPEVSGGNSRFLVGISVSGESMSQNAPIELKFGDDQVYTILYWPQEFISLKFIISRFFVDILFEIPNVETSNKIKFSQNFRLFCTKWCFVLSESKRCAKPLFSGERGSAQVFRTPKIIEIDWLFLMIEQI